MGIEGGLSFTAPAFETVPIGGQLTTIVNEGPVSLADLKNTMPLRIGSLNPIREIKFNNPAEGKVYHESLSAQSAIAEAETILAQARKPAIVPSVVPQAGLLIVPVNDNNLYDLPAGRAGRIPYWHELNGHTLIRSHTSTVLNPIYSLSKISTQPTETVLPQPVVASAKAKEETVEERVEKQKPEERFTEEVEMEKRAYLEDEQALAQRRHEIREAIAKAKAEAERIGLGKLSGQLVARFMPAEHEGNRSQVVKRTGPDGSYQETVEAISGIAEFESVEKAIEESDEIVAEKKPIKLGKYGILVADEDVARVFKYRTVKPVQAYQEVIRRVIKKSSAQFRQSLGVNTIPPHSSLSQRAHPSESKTLGWTEVGQEEVKTETSLEDYPKLAEVFKKGC